MTTIADIQKVALGPFQKHRQLSMREAEMISLEIIELLCDSHCKDEATLKYLAKLITPSTYQDLLDERNLNKKCGYPICDREPERLRDPFSIDENTKQFLWENNPYAYLSIYCSKFHFRCSQFYEVQLSDEALFARTGIHLIDDSAQENETNKKYHIKLFEELLREKSSEEDIKSLIAGLMKLGLKSADGKEGDDDKQIEEDLSLWLSEIKIKEDQKPSILGDFTKEDKESS